ncbi:MAG: hypothetical protein ABGY42_03250 [bacterium]
MKYLKGELEGRSSTNQTIKVSASRGALPGSYTIKLIGEKTPVTLRTLLEVVARVTPNVHRDNSQG